MSIAVADGKLAATAIWQEICLAAPPSVVGKKSLER
jgi:hypothetical protein